MLPKNLHNPPEHVNFYELLPYSGSFKSLCPFCDKGLLPVSRNQESGELLPADRCLLCGQLVIYDDFELMKKFNGRTEAMNTEVN